MSMRPSVSRSESFEGILVRLVILQNRLRTETKRVAMKRMAGSDDGSLPVPVSEWFLPKRGSARSRS